MEELRSKSYGDGGRMEQIESYNGNVGMQDLRCCRASTIGQTQIPNNDVKLKKGKSKSWSLNDPELQRKKRVASYKVYTVEGKVKGSFKNSFRWIKDKYTRVFYGWW